MKINEALTNAKLSDNLEIKVEDGKLLFIDNENQLTFEIWSKKPEVISESELNTLAERHRGSEWNRESGKYANYVRIGESKFNALITEKHGWVKVGSTKYGRSMVCHELGVSRPLTMGEFYGNGVVD